ncbi:MAG: SdrD B-like domain-containing protein, partial [Ferruginibacter sp.]
MKKKYVFLILLLLMMNHLNHAQVSGLVFRDYNCDGIRGTAFPDVNPGAAAVIVNAYNTANTCIASYQSAASGTYSIPSSGVTFNGITGSNTGFVMPGEKVRIEFVLPASNTDPSGPLRNTDHAGSSAKIYGSAVRFVAGGATNINFAINNPDDYTGSTNPYITTSLFVNGTYNNAVSGAYTSVYSFPYNNTGNPHGDYFGGGNMPKAKAYISQTGSLWGQAYQRLSKTLFVSALVRRFTGLGPLGTGGIYKIDMTNPVSASGAVPFINVNSIGINTGTDLRNSSNCDSISTHPFIPSHDIAMSYEVGKRGIGGIDYDEKRNTLWLVNMYDRKLYGIDQLDPSSPPTSTNVLGGYSISLPSGYSVNNGVLRPWAIKAYRGNIYVGAVADASAVGDIFSLNDLFGYILKFNPDNPSVGFSVVANFPLNYKHPGWGPTSGLQTWTNWIDPVFHYWANRWTSQPILSDIEFDTDGSIIAGLTDRGGLQAAYDNYNDISCSSYNMYEQGGSGDVIRLCKTSAGYIVSESAGCTSSIPSNIIIDGDGDPSAPNNYIQEYYWGDYGPETDNSSFNETAIGSLALWPGSDQVMTSATDPENYHSNGVITLDNKTGGDVNRYNIYYSYPSGSTGATMSKAVGLGDLEVIAAVPPIEIGNRVWYDADYDGIQDANETGIPAVEMELLNASGTVIASTVTDADGTYYFTTAAGTTAAGIAYNVSIQPNTPYKIRVKGTVNTLFSLTGNAGLGSTHYFAYADVAGSGEADWSDNDGVITGGVGGSFQASFVTGRYGENNHNIDFGFTTFRVLTLKWISFTAKTEGAAVKLDWKVNSQENLKNYIVEFSKDAAIFTGI